MEQIPYDYYNDAGYVPFPYDAAFIQEFLDFMDKTKSKKLAVIIDIPQHFEKVVSEHLLDIEELELNIGSSPCDWSAIKKFSKLKKLHIKSHEFIADEIDFDWFPRLVWYAGPFGSNLKNLENSKVEEIYLTKDASCKITDFKAHKLPPTVKKLVLSYLALQSFAGIPKSVENLECYVLRSLKDISDLAFTKNINTIWLKQVNLSNDMFPPINSLTFLRIGNTKIDSIKFIEQLPNLKNLYLPPKILDNDLTCLKGRKWELIQFKDNPAYNVKLKDLERQ